MGATNISALVVPMATPNEFQQPLLNRSYDIDVTAAAYSGIETQATHNIIPVPLGYALTFLEVIVLTAFTGSGATVQFGLTVDSVSDVLTGAVPVANLTKGDVVKGAFQPTTTSSIKAYAHTAAGTINMIVASGDLTAGRMLVNCGFRKVADFLTNG